MNVWIGVFDFTLAAVLLISIVGSLIILNLVLFKFDDLMRLFENSKLIGMREGFVENFWGRWFIVITMCTTVAFSSKQIRQGVLDRADFEKIPRSFVWLLKGLSFASILCMVFMFILVGLGRYMGWMVRS